jgi:hypothetical protein
MSGCHGLRAADWLKMECVAFGVAMGNERVQKRFQYLTFYSLAVTLRTTSSNIQKFYLVLTLHLCVLYGCPNKQRLLSYTELSDCFL